MNNGDSNDFANETYKNKNNNLTNCVILHFPIVYIYVSSVTKTIISLHRTNRLFSVKDTDCVLCEVQTEP